MSTNLSAAAGGSLPAASARKRKAKAEAVDGATSSPVAPATSPKDLFTPLKSDRPAAAADSSAARFSSSRKRSHARVAYEEQDDEVEAKEGEQDAAMTDAPDAALSTPRKRSSSASSANVGASGSAKRSASSSSSKKPKAASGPPENWQQIYRGIEEMRLNGIARNAPVDTAGCERLADKTVPAHVFRWQTLVSLMLSAQTKDQVTAQAMKNLNSHFADKGTCTVDNILAADETLIDSLICKVGFHQRKANFIKRTAAVCNEKYGGDIPATLEELVALPGVGPKMAHLTMQCAWKNIVGIGVDTHVHRISGRLGWVKSQTPEQTRMQLEEWLPREYWGAINIMLVGFGQMVCLPIGPKCKSCHVNSLCPTGRANLRYDKSPDKFHPIPPSQTVEQIKQEDEQIATAVLQQQAMQKQPPDMPQPIAASLTAAASSSQPQVVTSRFFSAPAAASTPAAAAFQPQIKTGDEPMPQQSEPTVKIEPVDEVQRLAPKKIKLEKL